MQLAQNIAVASTIGPEWEIAIIPPRNTHFVLSDYLFASNMKCKGVGAWISCIPFGVTKSMVAPRLRGTARRDTLIWERQKQPS